MTRKSRSVLVMEQATDRREECHHLDPIDSESKGAFCPVGEDSASRAVSEIFDDFDARSST